MSLPATREAGWLRRVVVRPLQWPERERWERLMKAHHYLGFRALIGESLRYVAEWEGRWVALLAWSSAALKCGVRYRWMGWSAVLQYQRLHLMANNSRFLMLPGGRVRDLASRVLGLNVRRLSGDWQRVYGHPVWVVETFVDPARFRGTCYRAAGWVELGQTRGFGKRGKHYVEHGKVKRVFARVLERGALDRLADPRPDPELSRRIRPMKLSVRNSDDLIQVLRGLPEPRKARGIRHQKASILAVAICAVLSGARSYTAIGEWAQRCSQNLLRRLRCRKDPHSGLYAPPTESTIRRLLQAIDVEAVDRALRGWLSQLAGPRSGAIAIDGKTLRGARRADNTQVQLLSAFVHQQGITVAQQAVDPQSNEIPAARELLQPLDLAGQVVTADALHTQTELASYLKQDKGAEYCFTVKDNQPTLKEDIATLELERSFPP